jgi:hypothetical protein
LTAFTDGCPGRRRILLDAGVEGLPILDWFHVAMRLRHLRQVAGGLSSEGPERAAAKAAVVAAVERFLRDHAPPVEPAGARTSPWTRAARLEAAGADGRWVGPATWGDAHPWG